MKQATKRELFDFIVARVRDVGHLQGIPPFRAFPRWFAELYLSSPENLVSVDGAGDGKVDFFCRTVLGNTVTHHVFNCKFTEKYDHSAPVDFYDEVLAFYQLFRDPMGRDKFLKLKVKAELRPIYRNLFTAFDNGRVRLVFLTNCRANQGQLARVEQLEVETFHLEDLVQHVLDDLDGAMPRTQDLTLQQIGTTLSPPTDETGVSTTIVFARLVDFIEYMNEDPYELLFARNVRVSQGNTSVNRAIAETFTEHPDEFAYSNNGLTILCERATHNPGAQELRLVNPRVVNGSQTLHSVRDAWGSGAAAGATGAKRARVMVRIVTIPPPTGADGRVPGRGGNSVAGPLLDR